MSKQWGHGYYTGHKAGEDFGVLCGKGSMESALLNSGASDRLMIIASSIYFVVNQPLGRNEIWWQMYCAAVAREIESIAAIIPGALNCVIERNEEPAS